MRVADSYGVDSGRERLSHVASGSCSSSYVREGGPYAGCWRVVLAPPCREDNRDLSKVGRDHTLRDERRVFSLPRASPWAETKPQHWRNTSLILEPAALTSAGDNPRSPARFSRLRCKHFSHVPYIRPAPPSDTNKTTGAPCRKQGGAKGGC
ncbi:hypothetical protein VUR80DRAFT_7906 [Thermomyces stellatus]